MKSKTLSKIGIIGGIILATPLVLAGLAMLGFTIFGCLMGLSMGIRDSIEYQDIKRTQIPFDAELWKGAAPTDAKVDKTRAYMIDDLLDQYDFTGWSESEVVELLGPPDSVGTKTQKAWYNLGTFGHDLVFTYDENGRVIEYRERWNPT